MLEKFIYQIAEFIFEPERKGLEAEGGVSGPALGY